MKPRAPSQTARIAAICRAVHTLLADEPKILVDAYARGLAGFDSDQDLLAYFNAQPFSHLAGLPTLFSLRSRYTEDELASAVERGIMEYVILGAGLDSFAYRRPDLMERINVYEVDHPASQVWKRKRATELGLVTPPRLHYAPIDFEHQTLADGLTEAGPDRGKPVFVSLLGVTQYLTRPALLRMLRDIGALRSAGCRLVIEFIPPFSTLDEDEAAVMSDTVERFALVGEPWLTHFTSSEMEEVLHDSGFSQVEHFDPDAANDRYLRGRTNGSFMPRFVAYARADTE